ncbi:ABC transporter permease [Erysipelothrix larvae]|uniref:ABC transporter permease n=1 Tax=Erysipelothrix larvae TaxID=1514105 RepID=A0A0X8H186_9FIRM|nr:ABC transporter permease [Erysipelothrix larvae]AMC94192.1 ABC transporter permease [Erysipelothrix larvae]
MKVYRRLVIPYIVWISLLIVVPMLLIVLYAFTTTGSNTIVPIHFTLEHFKRFFEPVFLQVLWQSLKIALITTVICLIIGYPLAYIISRKSEKMQTFLILLVTIPMWINMLIRTYAWISILSDVGLINGFLAKFGLGPIKMLYTDFAVVLGMVYNFLPFMIIQIYTVLSRMDNSLIEASYDLGANRRQTFMKVVFPLSLSGVISGITLVFLPAVSTFVIPQFLGGGQYILIGNLIEKQFITQGNWNFGSAISLIMAALIMVSMHLTNRVDQTVDNDRPSKKVKEA